MFDDDDYQDLVLNMDGIWLLRNTLDYVEVVVNLFVGLHLRSIDKVEGRYFNLQTTTLRRETTRD